MVNLKFKTTTSANTARRYLGMQEVARFKKVTMTDRQADEFFTALFDKPIYQRYYLTSDIELEVGR